MKIRELYDLLEEKYPDTLSCSWDNDGLMVCEDGEREIKRAFVTLDVTEGCVKQAYKLGCDVIISHHPLLFHPLKALDSSMIKPKIAIELIKNGMSVISLHTRFDASDNGMNDSLARTLGLRPERRFGEKGEEIGVVCSCEPMTPEALCERVKSAFGAPCVKLGKATDRVCKIAVLGGDGGGFEQAAAEVADTFITGDLSYNRALDACDGGLNVIEAGHFYTENIFNKIISSYLSSIGIPNVINESECPIKII